MDIASGCEWRDTCSYVEGLKEEIDTYELLRRSTTRLPKLRFSNRRNRPMSQLSTELDKILGAGRFLAF
jgi:hypothetical protein